MAVSRCLLLFLFISMFSSFDFAEIRFTKIQSDGRPIIALDEFGFTHTGRLQLHVSDIRLSHLSYLDLDNVGFFLCTRDAWLHVLQQLAWGELVCALDSKIVKVVSTFKAMKNGSIDYFYQETEADQYTLVFANCLNQVSVSMNVRSAMYNLDGRNIRDYLSTGETILPSVYFLLSLVYFTLAGIWIYVLHKKGVTVFKIHFFMLTVVILTAFNLICEAENKSYIKRTGSAGGHCWDVLFYAFSFLKGITFYTLIVLIGSGWSFLKPDLQNKEKRVLMIVITLQVVANSAQVVMDRTGLLSRDWILWKRVDLLVATACYCAVLFPIIWSTKNLREAARTDGKAAVYLMKLTLFRKYCLFYFFSTVLVVSALARITSYEYLEASVLVGKLATLAFYVLTGYTYKPEAHDPYFVIDDCEEKAPAEQLINEEKICKMVEENGAGGSNWD